MRPMQDVCVLYYHVMFVRMEIALITKCKKIKC